MKTAVEWLYDEIKHIIPDDFLVRFQQAKAMEKKEKAKEYLNGFKDGKEYQTKLDELTFKLTFKSE
jgi:hypothetical protein